MLYSLSGQWAHDRPPRSGESFRDYHVLGKTVITDPKIKQELIDALDKSMHELADQAACHIPHHGIRAVSGSRTIDVRICFGCQNISVFNGDRSFGSTISRSAAPLFNRILKQNRVPMPENSDVGPTKVPPADDE